VSSIEPNESSGEVDCGEEVSSSFVVAGGDGAKLLELAVEVFDEMASLVELLVESSRRLARAPWWDDKGLSCAQQGVNDTLVGIEGFVGQQGGGLHVRQQRIGAAQIMGLPRGQKEAQGVAQSIDQGVDLGAQSAFAAPDRLVCAVFFWAPALC